MPTTNTTRESRLRRVAHRQGLTLRKARVRNPPAPSFGMFYIADQNNRLVSSGGSNGHDMTLEDVEAYLRDAAK